MQNISELQLRKGPKNIQSVIIQIGYQINIAISLRNRIIMNLWFLSSRWFFWHFLLWLNVLCLYFFRFMRSLYVLNIFFINFLFYFMLILLYSYLVLCLILYVILTTILYYFRLWFSLKLWFFFIFLSVKTTLWHVLRLYFSDKMNFFDDRMMANNGSPIIVNSEYVSII